MMSVMRDIDRQSDGPITLTSAYDNLVEKFRAYLLCRVSYLSSRGTRIAAQAAA